MFLSGMLTRRRTAIKAGAWRRWRLWIPVAAWMAGIFYLSHQQAPAGDAGGEPWSSVAHVVLYAGLAALLFSALSNSAETRATWAVACLAFSASVLYGVSDELHQAFVPGRTASEIDLALNGLGAALGAGAAFLARAALRRLSRPSPQDGSASRRH